MKQLLFDVGEMLKVTGRIIGSLCMLKFKTVFHALRCIVLFSAICALAGLVKRYAYMRLIGLALVLIGLYFVQRTHKILPVPGQGEPQELITDGTFSVVRHPMYSGCCLAEFGAAVMASRWYVWIPAAVYCIVMLSVSCGEDEENNRIFGKEYAAYSREVPLTGILYGLVRKVVTG